VTQRGVTTPDDNHDLISTSVLRAENVSGAVPMAVADPEQPFTGTVELTPRPGRPLATNPFHSDFDEAIRGVDHRRKTLHYCLDAHHRRKPDDRPRRSRQE